MSHCRAAFDANFNSVVPHFVVNLCTVTQLFIPLSRRSCRINYCFHAVLRRTFNIVVRILLPHNFMPCRSLLPRYFTLPRYYVAACRLSLLVLSFRVLYVMRSPFQCFSIALLASLYFLSFRVLHFNALLSPRHFFRSPSCIMSFVILLSLCYAFAVSILFYCSACVTLFSYRFAFAVSMLYYFRAALIAAPYSIIALLSIFALHSFCSYFF